MKAKLGAIMALLFAGGLQAGDIRTTKDDSSAVVSPKDVKTSGRVSQSRFIEFDGMGGIVNRYFDGGRPPKQYGQWLQATRRQKWTKSKKR